MRTLRHFVSALVFCFSGCGVLGSSSSGDAPPTTALNPSAVLFEVGRASSAHELFHPPREPLAELEAALADAEGAERDVRLSAVIRARLGLLERAHARLPGLQVAVAEAVERRAAAEQAQRDRADRLAREAEEALVAREGDYDDEDDEEDYDEEDYDEEDYDEEDYDEEDYDEEDYDEEDYDEEDYDDEDYDDEDYDDEDYDDEDYDEEDYDEEDYDDEDYDDEDYDDELASRGGVRRWGKSRAKQSTREARWARRRAREARRGRRASRARVSRARASRARVSRAGASRAGASRAGAPRARASRAGASARRARLRARRAERRERDRARASVRRDRARHARARRSEARRPEAQVVEAAPDSAEVPRVADDVRGPAELVDREDAARARLADAQAVMRAQRAGLSRLASRHRGAAADVREQLAFALVWAAWRTGHATASSLAERFTQSHQSGDYLAIAWMIRGEIAQSEQQPEASLAAFRFGMNRLGEPIYAYSLWRSATVQETVGDLDAARESLLGVEREGCARETHELVRRLSYAAASQLGHNVRLDPDGVTRPETCEVVSAVARETGWQPAE